MLIIEGLRVQHCVPNLRFERTSVECYWSFICEFPPDDSMINMMVMIALITQSELSMTM